MNFRLLSFFAAASLLLSGCATGGPVPVSRDTIMAKAGRYTKGSGYRYIGATGRSVYMEYVRVRLFGNHVEVWAAPRKDFSEADLKALEKRLLERF